MVHGEWINCHACAFGSSRKKLTTFLVSDADLYKSLEKYCPGDHDHEPWGFDPIAATFNTAKEAEYPDGMCRTFADIVQSIVAQKGLHVDDFHVQVLSQCASSAETWTSDPSDCVRVPVDKDHACGVCSCH